MVNVLASDGLAPWGQVAGIVLAIYLFLMILVGLALAAALMFVFVWLHQKSALLQQIRPRLMQVNQALRTAKSGNPLPAQMAEDHPIIAAVVQAPRVVENAAIRASHLEQNVERGSQRVADVVIEFHARTEMLKGMAKAFFLPGLTPRRLATPSAQQQQQQQQQEQELELELELEQEQEMVAEQIRIEEPPMEQEIVIRRR